MQRLVTPCTVGQAALLAGPVVEAHDRIDADCAGDRSERSPDRIASTWTRMASLRSHSHPHLRYRHLLSDSKLNATESPKLFATEKKSADIIVLLLE